MRYFYFGDDDKFILVDEHSLSYDKNINWTYGKAMTFKISEDNLRDYIKEKNETVKDDELKDYFNEFKQDIFENACIEKHKEISF